MKKSNGRKLGLLIILVIMSAGFFAFKQVQRIARVKPRYVLEKTQISPKTTIYDNGKTADTEIDVFIKDRWPYFAQTRETRSWTIGPAWITYKSGTRQQVENPISEDLMPHQTKNTLRVINYKVSLKRLPKGANNVFLNSDIKIEDQTGEESQIPLRIKLR